MGGRRPTSPRAIEFAHRYLEVLNATQAAIDVGYSEKSARYRGARLMKTEVVKKIIEEEMAARQERSRVAIDRIIEELAPMALSNIDHYDIDDEGFVKLADGAPASAMRAVSAIKRKVRVIPRKDQQAVVEYETELKLWDKNSAHERAMQYLGLIKKRHEHTGKDGAPLPAPQTVLYIPDNHRDGPSKTAPLASNRIAEHLRDGAGN